MRPLVLATLFACGLFAGRPAWAAGSGTGAGLRVAVLRLEFAGEIPQAARDLLGQRLVEGLAAARFEVLAGADMARRLSAKGINPDKCRDAACHAKAAAVFGVAYLVVGKVSEKQKTYDITLELLDGRRGTSLGERRERCELCGLEDAGEKMALAATPLRDRLEALVKAPARFVVRSHPSEASVYVDGKKVGVTPYETELPGGAHQIRLRAPGYIASERSVTVVAGVDETLDIALVPKGGRAPLAELGWAGVLVGAAFVAGGAVAVGIDGGEVSCVDSAKDAAGHCPDVRNTRVLGAVLTGLGGAMAAMGGVALYLSSTTPKADGDDEPVAMGGSRSRGLVIGASGRF